MSRSSGKPAPFRFIPSSTKRAGDFANLSRSWWLRAKRERFYDGRRITWLISANHQPSELGSRGFLPQPVRDRRFVLIGAGALGSSVAEHLVRTGVTHLTIFDTDSIQIRNLVRHTLTLDDVPGPKSLQLAKRLQAITPLACAVGFNEKFPPTSTEARNAVQGAEVIIDTTGNDQVLTDLGRVTWDTPKNFISLSLAWRAAALYVYAERTTRFNAYAYQQAVRPQLARDFVPIDEDPTVMDGIGCWDPVWPALHTDVQLLAATGAKFVASFLQQEKPQWFQVYEQINGPQDSKGFGCARPTPREAAVPLQIEGCPLRPDTVGKRGQAHA